jgi:hypothetical protein
MRTPDARASALRELRGGKAMRRREAGRFMTNGVLWENESNWKELPC